MSAPWRSAALLFAMGVASAAILNAQTLHVAASSAVQEGAPASMGKTLPQFAQLAAGSATLNLTSGIAVWGWNGDVILNRALQDPASWWSELRSLSINRLYLSMNAAQIDAAMTDAQPLDNFLGDARRNGVTVELLLGESSWIEPAQRQKLVQIIRQLSRFRFAQLHLDIEPDQVYPTPINKTQYDQWISTFRDAAAASPWPLSVDVHPRYFRDEPFRSWNTATRLRSAGVDEVTLMVYNANPQAVINIVKPILSAAGTLPFRVGQSVEAGLDDTESHARRTPSDLQSSFSQLQKQLSAIRNFKGLAVQGFTDLEAFINRG